MTIVHSEWLALQSERRQSRAQHPVPVLQQAAVAAEHLTTSPQWNMLLSYLQEACNRSEVALRALQTQIIGPVSRAERDVMLEECIRINARIEAWRGVMSLPRTIIETGRCVDQEEPERDAA